MHLPMTHFSKGHWSFTGFYLFLSLTHGAVAWVHTHGGHEAVVEVFIREKNSVFDEDGARSQDEGEEQVDVDVVPGAVKLPAEQRK